MTEYRIAKPEEQAELTAFGSMVFSGEDETIDFETLIPKEYAKDRSCAGHHLLAVNEQGIRGMVATLPGSMHVGQYTLKTGYVGTVSVHPQARGEGHMKKLMALSLNRMQENGVDVSVLGGRRQRYAYFGYEPGGYEYHASFRPFTIRQAMTDVEAEGLSFTPIETGKEDEALALKLQESQPCWVDRKPFGFGSGRRVLPLRRVGSAPKRHIRRLCDRQSGKNVDFRAGRHRRLSAGSAGQGVVLQNELDRLTVTIPGWNRPLLACLNRYAEGMEMTPCEKIQILRYRPVLEALLTLKGHYAPLADGVLALEADGQTVTVTVTDGAVQVADGGDSPWELTHREMHELLLNPFAVDLQERAPRGWFPLPWHTPTADTF